MVDVDDHRGLTDGIQVLARALGVGGVEDEQGHTLGKRITVDTLDAGQEPPGAGHRP